MIRSFGLVPGLLLAALLVGVTLAACRGGQLPEVVNVRDVSTAHGRPAIGEIIDLGGVTVPLEGRLRGAHRDGQAVIGELLLLEGSGFGKQPTVSIGGRPATVLGRVEGGGIVVRVPWGIDPGDVEIEVSTAGGRHARSFPISRVGLVATGRALLPFRVSRDGSVAAGQQVQLPGAEALAISSDGVAAYVAGVSGGRARLRVVDLAAPQLAVVAEHELAGQRVVEMVAAEQATLAAVITESHLQLFDTRDPLRVAPYPAVALPASLRGRRLLAAALGGQGRLLAFLFADQNEVAVLELDLRSSSLAAPATLAVLPGTPLSLVEDLRFSADEGTLWVVSGDTPRSIASGNQPMRITLVKVSRGGAGLELAVHRTWELGERDAPRQLAVARGDPIPPGTVIRPEPSTSAVYVAAVPSQFVAPGVGRSLGGAVLRSAPGQAAARLLAGPRLLTSVDVVGKTQIVLGLGLEQRTGGGLSRVLLSQRAWEREAARVLQLEAADLPGTPPWIGEVRAQP